MPSNFEPATLYDALDSMGGGANLGDSPLDLPPDVMAGAINTTVTGKNATHRPCYCNRIINATGTPGFAAVFGSGTPVFQGMTETLCLDDTGNAFVIALISGRVFSFAIGVNGGNPASTANTITCTELPIYSGSGASPQPQTGGIVAASEIYNATVINASITINGTPYSGTLVSAVIFDAELNGQIIISGACEPGGSITSAANVTTVFPTASTVLITTTTDAFLVNGTITGVTVPTSGTGQASVTGPANVIQPQAWCWQTECWVIIQDGLENPIIVNLNTQVAMRSNFGVPTKYSSTLSSGGGCNVPSFTLNFNSVANLPVGTRVGIAGIGYFIVTGISGNSVTFQNNTYFLPIATSGLKVWWTAPGTGLQPGRMGAYGLQRNWMVLTSIYQFIALDLCGGASGTSNYNFRDSVFESTENSYVTGGGTFCVPGGSGPITAMKFLAVQNVALGQGPLQVCTHKKVFSCQAPVDRLTWQSVTNPILTESVITNGAKGQWSTVVANSDLFMRSVDGIRSLTLAELESNEWGTVPCSFEVSPILNLDNQALLPFGSAIVFGNRLLMTCGPAQTANGVYHEGLVPMNFAPISSLRGKAPAVWDSGTWIGSGPTSQMQILQMTVGEVNEDERAFALVLNTTAPPNTIEFWEILSDGEATADNDGTNNIPIPWQFDSASMRFGVNRRDRKYMQLSNGEIWIDKLVGTVTFQVLWKPDQFPSWTNWNAWQSVQTVDAPDSQPAFLPRMGLGQPSAASIDASTNRPLREGFTFQTRHVFVGHCIFLGAFFESETKPMSKFAKAIHANTGSSGGSSNMAGVGSPQGTVAAAGTTYIDTKTDNFWVNVTGTATGWIPLIGGP
jgi:hypothetical protein